MNQRIKLGGLAVSPGRCPPAMYYVGVECLVLCADSSFQPFSGVTSVRMSIISTAGTTLLKPGSRKKANEGGDRIKRAHTHILSHPEPFLLPGNREGLNDNQARDFDNSDQPLDTRVLHQAFTKPLEHFNSTSRHDNVVAAESRSIKHQHDPTRKKKCHAHSESNSHGHRPR